MSDKKDGLIKPPLAEAHAEGVASIKIKAVKDEIKAVIKVNPTIFILVVILIVVKNFIPLFTQSIYGMTTQLIIEVSIITLGIYLISIRIKRLISISGKSTTGTRGSGSLNVEKRSGKTEETNKSE